jgi:mRNA interferase RelE/StbE
MPYEIIISPRAMKDLKNLPKEAAARIIETLDRIRNDPVSHVYRLRDSPLYSVHVGEYRIILDILRQKLLVLVVRIGHRRNVYRKIG